MKTPTYIALPTDQVQSIITDLWSTVNGAEESGRGIHPDDLRQVVSQLYWLVKTTLEHPDAQSCLQGDALVKNPTKELIEQIHRTIQMSATCRPDGKIGMYALSKDEYNDIVGMLQKIKESK